MALAMHPKARSQCREPYQPAAAAPVLHASTLMCSMMSISPDPGQRPYLPQPNFMGSGHSDGSGSSQAAGQAALPGLN